MKQVSASTHNFEEEGMVLSINTNNTNVAVAAFSTIISASEQESECIDRITAISNEFMKLTGGNILQYAHQFDLYKEKLKFKEFLASKFMQDNLHFWTERVGVHYVLDDTLELPRNIICIIQKFDKDGLPEYYKISFISDFSKPELEIDWQNISKEVEHIKKHQLTYGDNISELFKEIKMIKEKLKASTTQQRLEMLLNFNKKWEGQLIMTYLVNEAERTDMFMVEDIAGKEIINCSSNNIRVDTDSENILRISDKYPAIAKTQMSFWNRNIAAAVAVAAVGVGVALYSLNNK